jgi:hypothetical protein
LRERRASALYPELTTFRCGRCGTIVTLESDRPRRRNSGCSVRYRT